MRLKEIKPGMVIHCKNEEEKKALLEEAERLGYVWYGSEQKPTEKLSSTGNTIHFYDASLLAEYKYITHSGQIGGDIIEFSDLIIPDMSAEEAFQIATEICEATKCADCPMNGCCFKSNSSDKKQVVESLGKWKSDHEKKEPEVETVDICRIIEIQQNGYKRCVHEEDIETELPFGGDEREKVEEILKRYCMEHDGNFIAVHEVVSRVKAVE